MSDGNTIPSNVGTYLARRLINVGIKEYYAVPGTSNYICDSRLSHVKVDVSSLPEAAVTSFESYLSVQPHLSVRDSSID